MTEERTIQTDPEPEPDRIIHTDSDPVRTAAGAAAIIETIVWSVVVLVLLVVALVALHVYVHLF
jgi:hypothetical protein